MGKISRKAGSRLEPEVQQVVFDYLDEKDRPTYKDAVRRLDENFPELYLSRRTYDRMLQEHRESKVRRLSLREQMENLEEWIAFGEGPEFYHAYIEAKKKGLELADGIPNRSEPSNTLESTKSARRALEGKVSQGGAQENNDVPSFPPPWGSLSEQEKRSIVERIRRK